MATLPRRTHPAVYIFSGRSPSWSVGNPHPPLARDPKTSLCEPQSTTLDNGFFSPLGDFGPARKRVHDQDDDIRRSVEYMAKNGFGPLPVFSDVGKSRCASPTSDVFFTCPRMTPPLLPEDNHDRDAADNPKFGQLSSLMEKISPEQCRFIDDGNHTHGTSLGVHRARSVSSDYPSQGMPDTRSSVSAGSPAYDEHHQANGMFSDLSQYNPCASLDGPPWRGRLKENSHQNYPEQGEATGLASNRESTRVGTNKGSASDDSQSHMGSSYEEIDLHAETQVKRSLERCLQALRKLLYKSNPKHWMKVPKEMSREKPSKRKTSKEKAPKEKKVKSAKTSDREKKTFKWIEKFDALQKKAAKGSETKDAKSAKGAKDAGGRDGAEVGVLTVEA